MCCVCKRASYSNFSKLSDSRVYIPVHLPDLCMMSRASFCNFCKLFFTASNSFLNTQDIYNSMFWAVSRNFILQLFATFSIFACYFSQLFSIFACKIGCFKSFTVKCAHKCNLQHINATFAENKCNFLALLLQQKLALMMSIPREKNQQRQARFYPRVIDRFGRDPDVCSSRFYMTLTSSVATSGVLNEVLKTFPVVRLPI